MSKPHKFFDTYIDNNLDELHNYLIKKRDDILSGLIFDLSDDEKNRFSIINGPSTQLAHKYNAFNFDHAGIINLKNGLNKVMQDACKYYDINFQSQDYLIHGWFNVDYKKTGADNESVSPLINNVHFHDHMDGVGAPVFHGYYCINAEPSSTYYMIDNEKIFENINKNNRAIVSETGHPHGRDDWYGDKERITLAYDIVPAEFLGINLEFLPSTWSIL